MSQTRWTHESRNRMTRVSDESATPGRDSSDRRVAAARRESGRLVRRAERALCRAGVEESRSDRQAGATGRRLVLYTSENSNVSTRVRGRDESNQHPTLTRDACWTWLIRRLYALCDGGWERGLGRCRCRWIKTKKGKSRTGYCLAWCGVWWLHCLALGKSVLFRVSYL